MTPLRIFLSLATAVCAIGCNASSFDDMVERIVDASPTLASENAAMQAELSITKSENVLSDPEVEFERLWNAAGGENRWGAGISQAFAWPGSYSARSKMIAALEAAQAARRAGNRAAMRTSAASLLIEIIATQKEIAILKEINSSIEQLHNNTLTAWNNGEVTILDVNKIKIERARSSARLETANNALHALEAELNSLAGNSGTSVVVPSDIEFPLPTLRPYQAYSDALEASPQYAETVLMQEVARHNTALAKADRLPGFSIGYNHAYEDGTHFNGLSVGIALPLWSRRHKILAATSSAMAADYDAIARHTELKAKLKADYANAQAVRAQMDAFGPVVEGTNNLQLLRKAYDGGELSLLNYIQEVNYFLEARLDYLALTKEYATLLTRLNAYTAPR